MMNEIFFKLFFDNKLKSKLTKYVLFEKMIVKVSDWRIY